MRRSPQSSGRSGIYAYYRGIAIGAMSVVVPIAGAGSAIPVAIGLLSGDRPSAVQVAGVACAVSGVVLASHERHEGSLRVAAGVGLALLAALGFGCYFLPMHVAGKVDFWWSTLVFRTTTLLLVAAAVSVSRPALRMRPPGPRRLRARRRR